MHPEDGDWTIEELRRAIQKGIDDLEAGRGSSGEEVFARLWSRRREAHARFSRIHSDNEALGQLRREIDVGIEEIQRGEGVSGPEAVEQSREEFQRLTQHNGSADAMEVSGKP